MKVVQVVAGVVRVVLVRVNTRKISGSKYRSKRQTHTRAATAPVRAVLGSVNTRNIRGSKSTRKISCCRIEQQTHSRDATTPIRALDFLQMESVSFYFERRLLP